MTVQAANTTKGESERARRLPRVAVVGCGYWGKNLIRNFAKLGALEALVDSDQAVRDALIAQHGGARGAGFDDVLCDPSIAAVVIAAPASSHFSLAKAAIEAGKDVFVEKPLALEVADAEVLCRLADQHDRRLMVGHLLQYHPAFLALKQLANSGEFGRLRHIVSTRLNLGKVRREEDVLWSFAPHDISMVLALAQSDPAAVTAIGSYQLRADIADIVTTHLCFADGLAAQIQVSWLHPFKEQKLAVIGERAMAVFDDGQPWERKLMIYRHAVEWRDARVSGVEGEPVAVESGEPLYNECQHFLDCVMTGATPRTDGREGVRVLSVLSQASKSLEANRQGIAS